MDVDDILGEVISGALGARRHRRHGPLGVLTGHHHAWWMNGSTLLAALGVAWGLYETANQSNTIAPPLPPPSAPPSQPAGAVAPVAAEPTGAPAAAAPPTPAAPAITPDVARVIRLTVSAARADGTLEQAERDAITAHARSVGAEAVVEQELAHATPLASLVAAAPADSRQDLYRLAFAIVRADGSVGGAERIYLAQLAHALGIEPASASALEQEAVAKLEAGGTTPPQA